MLNISEEGGRECTCILSLYLSSTSDSLNLGSSTICVTAREETRFRPDLFARVAARLRSPIQMLVNLSSGGVGRGYLKNTRLVRR